MYIHFNNWRIEKSFKCETKGKYTTGRSRSRWEYQVRKKVTKEGRAGGESEEKELWVERTDSYIHQYPDLLLALVNEMHIM